MDCLALSGDLSLVERAPVGVAHLNSDTFDAIPLKLTAIHCMSASLESLFVFLDDKL